MTVDAQSLALPLPASVSPIRRQWIESPLFDLLFFTFSGVSTLPFVVLALAVDQRFGVLFFLLAFPHYLSTLTFYFWDENYDRHHARALAFFGGPVVIAAAVVALMLTGLPAIVMITLFLWNTFHVARQNCGILSIYRVRSGNYDLREKSAANAAIIATNFWFAFWNIETLEPLQGMGAQWMQRLRDIRLALGIIAVVTLLHLARVLWKRTAVGNAMKAPELLFLAMAVTFFHPYLWMPTSNSATAVMLMPHYLQYLGIVWLIHRRRSRSGIAEHPRALRWISASTPVLLASILAAGSAAIAASIILRHAGYATLFGSFIVLIALEHFYLDGLFWAFRDPAVRKSMGPYLTASAVRDAA